jgi:uncharacterized membrane protein YgcG
MWGVVFTASVVFLFFPNLSRYTPVYYKKSESAITLSNGAPPYFSTPILTLTLCRWASSACSRVHALHSSICDSGEEIKSEATRGGGSGSGGTGASRGGGIKDVSGGPSHVLIQASCGALGASRRAILWVLQLGLQMAARVGLAIDEVLLQ